MTDLTKDLEAAYRAGDKIPKGWEPYTEQVDRIGSAIVRLPSPEHTERDLLIGAGFNPDLWRISGPVQARKWMAYDGRWLHYFKFDVEQGETAEAREINVEDLAKFIRRRKRKPLTTEVTGDAYAYLASDWQIGKALGDIGSEQTAERVADTIDQAVADIKALRRAGFMMPQGFFGALGDLGEGTCGFYPNQAFTIDLNRRDQNRVVRELITYGVDNLAPLFDSFKVATVAGNHGENRSLGGKVTTDESDNDDVAQFEAVREAFARAGDPGIEWIIPRDELAIQVDVAGVPVGMTHGHLFQRGPGGTAQRKAFEWWKDQDFGFQELRGTQVLLSAHFHHYSNVVYGRRSAIQMPPMDPGSKWFRDIKGQDSPAGAVVLRFDSTKHYGYDHLRILDPAA